MVECIRKVQDLGLRAYLSSVEVAMSPERCVKWTPRGDCYKAGLPKGLGFRMKGLGFRIWGLGFRIWGLGFRIQGGLGFRF